MKCAICGLDGQTKFLSLGHQPPSDAFLAKKDLEAPEVTYPLDLYFCNTCSLVQLGYAVDPSILFRDYVYNTGSNNALKVNFSELVKNLIQKFNLQAGDFAVDIGSNDGTLLENYVPYGIKVLGVDPSSVAKIAIEKGISTIVDFFGQEVAEKIVREQGKAKIITATNVFAHVVGLDSFMEGVKALLDEKGVFISENGYVVDMVEGMQYDSIYHEHLRYYSVISLAVLFERYGMEVIDVEHISSHGGSVRVFAASKGNMTISQNVSKFIKLEKEKGFNSVERYKDFAKEVTRTKFLLLDVIRDLKKKGARIVSVGAPAKGNTLLNYCKLDSDTVDYLAERSPLKIGLYSPGMHIPVVDEKRLFEEQPEAAILLSWNLADELVPKIKKLGFRGSFYYS